MKNRLEKIEQKLVVMKELHGVIHKQLGFLLKKTKELDTNQQETMKIVMMLNEAVGLLNK